MRILFFALLLGSVLACSKQNPVTDKKNNPPLILSITALPDSTEINNRIMVFCDARDEDGDRLSYQWGSQAIGTIQLMESDSIITWIAPDYLCRPWISCTVSDPDGESATDSVQVFVFDSSP